MQRNYRLVAYCRYCWYLASELEVRTEYLEATLGLVKRLEISKELIREYVTVLGCHCCIII